MARPSSGWILQLCRVRRPRSETLSRLAVSITCLSVSGAVQCPNYASLNSYSPWDVIKAVFSRSLLSTSVNQFSVFSFIEESYFAWQRCSRASPIRADDIPLFCNFIHQSVVNAETHCTVFFPGDDDLGQPGTFRRIYDFLGYVFNLLPDSSALVWRYTERWQPLRSGFIFCDECVYYQDRLLQLGGSRKTIAVAV